MNKLSEKPIGEMVAEDYRTASIFRKHQIDFCCQGGRSLSQACSEEGVSIWPLLRELEGLPPDNEPQAIDYRRWPTDLLADFIEKTHHRYVRKRSSEILPFLEKLIKVHAKRHPELITIGAHFSAAVKALQEHMIKEEQILFPYLRKMVTAQTISAPLPSPGFGTVNNPLASMEAEHEQEGQRFRAIAQLSQNYQPPADACNTYRVTYAMLREFEEDLHRHIHLENNILFPAARQLESELKKQAS